MLTLEQAEDIAEAANEASDWRYDIQVREGYSGRFMYGEQVTAFTADSTAALMAIGYAAGQVGVRLDDVPTRTDSMGMGVVIY